MKVCYVINQYPKVSHSFIRREILALEQLGAEVLRIGIRGWRETAVDPDDREEQRRTRYVLAGGAVGLLVGLIAALRHPARFVGALRQALRLSRGSDRPLVLHLVYLAEACVAARWIRCAGCRRIHAHFGTNSAEVALLAGILTGVPFSFTVHGPEEFDRPAAIGLPEKIRLATQVMAISSFGRSQLYRWTSASDWSRLHVIHCGLDSAFMTPPPPTAPSVDTFVCVGRLCEQKGQVLLLRAMALLRDRGIACRLVLAGDGEMRSLLEDEIGRLDLRDRIRITGWIDGARVREEILAARALVLPSFAEGLPVVLMESLALARPVVTTSIAGIPELVRDGENGWLVPAGDVDALAEAMQSCLAAPDAEILRLGAAGRLRVLARHDVSREASSLLELFKETA